MQTEKQITITKAGNEVRQMIVELLKSEKLPVEDLPVITDNFFVALCDGKIIGAIGLEQYENCGLLRSLVVDKTYRNKNTAFLLIQELEKHALTKGINIIYLLTETAPQYFQKKGYSQVPRETVPMAVKASSEFSHVCPVSAIVMNKDLGKKFR